MERLIGAILLKVVEDWDNPKYRPEIEEFLESDWFNALVETLNLEPAMVRDQLRLGRYRHLNIRAAYRKKGENSHGNLHCDILSRADRWPVAGSLGSSELAG